MNKNLSQIVESISFTDVTKNFIASCNLSNLDHEITSICFDSRNVTPGSLFFALPGIHIHGNSFIATAIEKGAVAVFFQDELSNEQIENIKHSIKASAFTFLTNEENSYKPPVFLHVNDTRFSMAPVAAAFYDNPSSKLGIIGVTGTEGKSSTVSFIWQLLKACGKKTGFISTVQYSIGKEAIDNSEHQTTPESPIIQERLYQMVQEGCEYAVIESSSHGLSKKTNRLGNVQFDAGVFMNVTQEHLEFHKTYEQYKSDKANLFRFLDENDHQKIINGQKVTVPSFGVVNLEDKAAEYFQAATNSPVFGFKIKDVPEKNSKKDCFSQAMSASNIKSNEFGVYFDIVDKTSNDNDSSIFLFIPLPGTFNVYNVMASLITVSHITGIKTPYLIPYISRLTPVRGRMTVIRAGQHFEVIVDYAHTPSSFQTIFPPLRQRTNGKIIALFGSGGERDIIKRPEQGRIASEYCDTIILTDEDPRGEDPVTLLEMIAKGIPCGDSEKTAPDGQVWEREKNLFIIPDRPKAIRKAVSLANDNDIVLLLGKAHENSIIYKNYVMPYDEITEIEKALAELILRI